MRRTSVPRDAEPVRPTRLEPPLQELRVWCEVEGEYWPESYLGCCGRVVSHCSAPTLSRLAPPSLADSHPVACGERVQGRELGHATGAGRLPIIRRPSVLAIGPDAGSAGSRRPIPIAQQRRDRVPDAWIERQSASESMSARRVGLFEARWFQFTAGGRDACGPSGGSLSMRPRAPSPCRPGNSTRRHGS